MREALDLAKVPHTTLHYHSMVCLLWGTDDGAAPLAKELAGYANALTMPSPEFLEEARRGLGRE